MPTSLENLVTIRESYITSLATEAAAQLTDGAHLDYTLDGVSVNYSTWRDAMLKNVDSITQTIVQMQGPVLVKSRGRV